MKQKLTDIKTSLLVGGITAAVLCVAALGGFFNSWQLKFADALYIGHEPARDVVLVAIDDRSIQTIGRWPWKRSAHANLIRILSEAGPRAIGYDVNFPESSDAAEDEKLAEAITASGLVVLPYELTIVRSDGGLIGKNPLYPIASISRGAHFGFSNTPTDSDGIFRRVPTSIRHEDTSIGEPFFAAVLAVADLAPAALPDELIINYAGPAGTYPTISAIDVLERKVSADRFRDAIVLVGATAPDLHDELFTPTGKTKPLSGIEVHANAVGTVLDRNPLADEPLGFVLATIIIFAFGGALFVSRFRMRVATPILAGIGGLYFLTAFILFDQGLILNLLYPTAALAFTYVSIVLLRYQREKTQKNQLRDTLQRYVSPQVAAHLIANPEKLVLGGEAREMSVLFSDLRGFTSLSEKLKPEELVRILNEYLTEMTDVVFAHEGVLDKYIGDAVMAFWGAPIDAPDHALRAVRTAVRMRDRLHELNTSGRWPVDIELRLGVGVNTGAMVVGNMGSRKRFDYTVMGDTVNLGSRLESLNKEYGTEIIVSESTAVVVRDEFTMRELDLVAVKGKKEPVKIFEVIGKKGSVNDAVMKFIEYFERALTLYRAQKFSEAREIFHQLAHTHHDDVSVRTFIDRCESFLENPPASEWDGTWVMTKK